MMMGALDGLAVNAEVLSYEGPFGVGYLVAALEPGRPEPGKSLLAGLEARRNDTVGKRRAGESYLVGVARQSLENYLRHGKKLSVPDEVPPEFRGEAAAFVSLKKHGQLRGCIGTVAPTRRSVVEEVIVNAISAGTHDPRFFPVQVDELDDLVYSVDVLQPPEPVEGLDDLDPKKYGVIVRAGRRSGLLLPDLEGVNTSAEQVAIARQKAGIGPNEPVELERFEVKRYK
jgi:AmmeMemoRadiSam system protein A